MAASFNTVSVGLTATLILASNPARRGFVLYNNGANVMYIGFDSSVATTTGIPILPQSSFELNADRCWKGAIYGITTSSNDDCRYWFWEG